MLDGSGCERHVAGDGSDDPLGVGHRPAHRKGQLRAPRHEPKCLAVELGGKPGELASAGRTR